jgi:amino acid adenylation domain-containing protein
MNDSETARESGPVPEVDYDPFAGSPAVEVASTAAQREMWLSAQAGSGAGCAYNQSFSVHLTGPVDDDALREAITALADCHEALRGRFSDDGERFVIEPSVTVPVAQHDLSGLPRGERVRVLERIQVADAEAAYDLGSGPLFRAAIVRLDVEERMVVLSANHAVCDGWSLDVLLADLGRLYSAFVGGIALPPPPRHGFSDYVRYSQTPEYAQRIESSRAFWHKALEVLPPPLELPHDGYRPAFRSYGANHSLHTVPAELLSAAKTFSRAQGFSFFSVLLSTYAALLNRISQQNEVVIGIPVAGHPDAGMEECVGHLVNLVPVRFRFEPELSFLDLCRRTNTAVLDARENAAVGFGEIVADLAVPRDPARVPLIATVLTHAQKYAPGKVVFTDCSVEYHLNSRCFETFELNLTAIESRDKLELKAHGNSDLFGQAWIDWRLREYECLLRNGCAAPGTTLQDLAWLPEDEASLVTLEFNRTDADYPRDVPLARLVEEQVERTPDAVAVVFGSQSLSFRELNARANQLAHELVVRGAGPDRIVGVCLERSVDMVVGLLAIVKAGAAYLPLDPALPLERLGYMLEDSGAAVVLTQESMRETLPAFTGTLVFIDDPGWKSNGRDNPAVAVRPTDLAYVIYTSGSTGKPKGVEVPRGALTNLLWSMRDWLRLGVADRLLAVTTISFDIAGVDIWLPLLVGARMVVSSREEAADGTQLRELIDKHGITFLQATPVTWRLLLEAGWEGKSDLQIVCTGEAMPRDLAGKLQPIVRRLWNLYGPTETTIWSTGYLVRDGTAAILIGRPVANTQCYVLDQRFRPAPIGVVGELFLGGDGLARGYLGRPELTAEKFLPDPFRDAPAARLYRTGDLARYLPDGNLECLGRTDHQVKIRGYRIELGEIEALLSSHPAVRQVVVDRWEAAPGDERLAAYVVLTHGAELGRGEMQEYLRRQLPDYMLPAAVVPMATLPLTPSGKIDRKALPAPDPARADLRTAAVAQTPTEQALCEIWRGTLGLDKVGRQDDFFELGGHSLLATQVASRVREVFQLELRLNAIFEARTIERLGRYLDEQSRKQRQAPLAPPIQPTVEEGPSELSFSQTRMWLAHALAPESAAYNVPLGIRLRGTLDPTALAQALDELRRRHDVLRSTFHLLDGQPMQRVEPWTSEALVAVDLRALGKAAWDEAVRRAEAEARAPFDLSRGPVLRCRLWRAGDAEHLLLLCVHHEIGRAHV